MGAITHAQIEPTTRCNFTCGFCAGRAMAQRDLRWEAFEAFLAAHPGLRRVELQGEGEPLLHRRFFDMVAACRERAIAVSIITNGSLLDDATVERLLDAGLDSIHVSLESADPAAFRAIRGGKFAKVRAGIARLIGRRRARGLARPVVGLTVTVLADTLAAFDGILGLYRTEGLDGGIVLQPLQRMAAYSRHYAPEIEAQLLTADQLARFGALRRQAAAHAPVGRREDFFYFDLFAGFDPRRGGCPWLERGVYLAADGAITGCCFMKEPDVAFGAAEGDNNERIRIRRTALADALDRGAVPEPCRDCGTAAAIARARTAATAA